MKNTDNLFALNYANLFIKIGLEEKINFKTLLKTINHFFSILEKQENKTSLFLSTIKNTINKNYSSYTKLDKVMLSILLKRKIYLKNKIMYFFIKTCNESLYLRYFKIKYAKEFSKEDKLKFNKDFSFNEETDIVEYEKNDNLLSGFVVENVNYIKDFSVLRYLNNIESFLIKTIDF